MKFQWVQSLTARVCLALLIVTLPLTWGAIRIYPSFDDAANELVLKENGVNAIKASLTDRPVVGWIVYQVMRSSHRFELGILLQFAGWFLLGLVAALMWMELFPDQREYTPVAACLSIAPILLKAQLATAMFVLTVNFSIIPVYAAGLILWRYVRVGNRGLLTVFSAAVLTFAGGMMTEYGLLTAAAFPVLLAGLNWDRERAVRRRLVQSIAVMVFCALGAHFLFAHIAEAHPVFTGVSFTPPAREVIAHWRIYATRLVRAFIFSSVGAYAQAIGQMAAQTVKGASSGLVILYPIAVAFTLAFCSRKNTGEPIASSVSYRRTIGALVAAVFAALVPACLLQPFLVGRDLHMEELSTRYYFVAAPLVVALTVRLLFEVFRPKFRLAVLLAVGFLAGDSVVEHLRGAYANTRTMREIGPLVEKYVRQNKKQTIVLTPDFYARDPEATYNASAGWPAELSRRVWVMWEMRAPVMLGGAPADRGSCGDIRFIDRNMRTIVRRGEVGQLLWLQPITGGGFRVEPYCLTPSPPQE